MPKYSNKAMEELAAELRSGLVRLRRGYLDAAEQVIQIIDPDQIYPFPFVVFRLTGYRPPEEGNPVLVEGRILRKDLLTLLLDVSASFELPTSEYDEPVYDQPALSKRFGVSTKTVQRWRKRGLPARRLVFPDGRRRIGFLDSSVRWFMHDHKQEVRRSMKFTQLTTEERREILRRARRMASFTHCSLSDVAKRLAKRTGRAPETIRYTIRKHDSEIPEQAIFPHLLNALGDKEKRQIYRSFLRGVAVPDLAREYRRTRGSIYRIINEVRALQLLERPISYVESEEFLAPDADETILAERPEADDGASRTTRIKPPTDLPPYLRSLYEVPLLTADRERDLFRRYNYLKFKADRQRKRIDMNHVLAQQVKDVESLLLQANVLKNQIVRANLRLVVSIAKKHIGGPLSLFELISDGNVSLMRAVEKFDYSKGFRFSTYASWAIMRNFARSVPKERYHHDRFSTGHESVLDIAAGLQSYDPNDDNIGELRESIDRMLKHLSARERTILMDHYGLDESNQPKTFDQLGKELGISKERVRQIEIQAIRKLRELSESVGAEE